MGNLPGLMIVEQVADLVSGQRSETGTELTGGQALS
jgi:hypothetical protein